MTKIVRDEGRVARAITSDIPSDRGSRGLGDRGVGFIVHPSTRSSENENCIVGRRQTGRGTLVRGGGGVAGWVALYSR